MSSRVAILIGVEICKANGYSRLNGPRNDVDVLSKLLGDPCVGFFDKVICLYDETSDSELKKIISQETKNLDSTDTILIYFSGHGDVSPHGQLHLILGETDTPFINSISFEDLSRIVCLGDCQNCLFILDCCYSGAVKNAGTNRGSDTHRNLSKVSKSLDLTILASGSAFSPSKINPASNKSFYTEALIKGLGTGFADLNSDGLILASALSLLKLRIS